jgi:D-aspartate ligase
MKDNQNPYAIVIGLDCFTGLQTARILVKRGVPVIAIASDLTHYCCKTKVCEDIFEADTGSEALIDTLMKLGPDLEKKAVLYPCTDLSVLMISRNRECLGDWFHVVLPEGDVIELLMDKMSFYTYAQKAGMPVPRTFFLRDNDEAFQAAGKLDYPCILKPPMKTPKWEEHTKAKVFKASDREDFLRLYEICSDWADVLMAQEWVEGSDASLYSCNCYFNTNSDPVVTFIARKLRQWPPETGTSCLGEEVRNDVVLEESIRLFRSVGYRGLGYVEMKRDERTGKHYFIEPNVGRPTGRSAIAEAGGVELLYTMYCDVVGLPMPDGLEQKYTGVKWIYLRRDLQSAAYYWRRGDLSLREWWNSLRGQKAFALFSWSDPAPFWGDIFHGLKRINVKRKTFKDIESVKPNRQPSEAA